MRKLAKDIKVGDAFDCVVLIYGIHYDEHALLPAVVDKVEYGDHIISITVSCSGYFKDVLFYTHHDTEIESFKLDRDVLRIYGPDSVIGKLSIYANGQNTNSVSRIEEPTYKRVITFEKFIYDGDDYADNYFVELAKENGYTMVSTTITNI